MISILDDGLIRVDGQLDFDSAGQLREVLLEAGAKQKTIALELSEVNLCDGAGLQMILAARAHAAAMGIPFAIPGLSDAVRETAAAFGFALEKGD